MKHHWSRAACIVVALLGMYAPLSLAGAPPTASPAPDRTVTLNFVNADIEGVVKVMAQITGKNFVIDPRVKGTVNIISAQPVASTAVYEVFLSALRLQGFAAVEDRGLVKILPEADAKLHRNAATGPSSAEDGIQTRVFTLSHQSAVQLLSTLRPLVAPNNTITALQNSNSLVVTDYASNLVRLAGIIAAIDQPDDAGLAMIALRHASALDTARTINNLFAPAPQAVQTLQGTDPTQRIAVIADPRSNSLLVRAADPARLAQIRQFAAMLDSPTSAAGNVHVVYLKNAEAVKLADTLRGIYSGAVATPAQATGAGAQAETLTAGGSGGFAGGSGTQATTGSGLSPVAATAMQASTESATVAAPGIIQADAATNAIIITAPDAVYNNLRAVVEKLDARRLQVYVEALVVELTANKAGEFGVQWQDLGGIGKAGTQVFGGTNFGGAGQNIIGIAQNPTRIGPGLNIGTIHGTVTVGGVQILNLGLLARALETDTNANILSTPTLLTLDNEEAKIVVGQNVPFITGQYAVSGATTTPSPFQTIERKDVGLTLKIRPQISEGGVVRLQIYQEVSSVADTANPAGVITNTRSIESTVLVNDGQIIVLGGLIQDSINGGVSKVPVLGSLPLLGGLFRYDNHSRSKTNLMVFLRPTILSDAQQADALTSERYDYIRGRQIQAEPVRGAAGRNDPPPLLPALPDAAAPTGRGQ
ncbi:MAG: type II secretion system secretin GspD [Rhodanobacter sp.]|uniref:type II secretion system secretin GspD n=1 Tax=Rhodanobacter sp. KK11 TaxID=3083255 RepID=UPI0029674821|nr:type II secretion system secretin GspD [Rhodanobacter sp. KK11]MDW2982499.1 type II secretion system secretin GspD [Rhodanobacter sp. KK11]